MAASSSSSSATTPVFQTWGAAAYSTAASPSKAKKWLQGFVEVLTQRTAKGSAEYKIEELKDRIYVYSLKKTASGEEKFVQLGYHNGLALWYTDHKNREKFQKNILSQMTFCKTLQSLELVPPFVAFQRIKPETFAQLPRQCAETRVKNVEVVPSENLSKFLEELLAVNSGIFFGNDHNGLKEGFVELLVDQMGALAAGGVCHFYDEVPIGELFPLYEQFNLDLEGKTGALECFLKFAEDPLAAERMKIYRAAKRAGIQVWPIDNKDKETNLERRISLGDGTMVRNVDYYAESRKGGKFAVLNGAAHYGVAEELGIPNVLLNRPDPKAESQIGGIVAKMNDKLAAQLSAEETEKIYKKAPDFIVTPQPNYAGKTVTIVATKAPKETGTSLSNSFAAQETTL